MRRTLFIVALLGLLVAASTAAAPPIPVLWSVSENGTQRAALTTLPSEGQILDRTERGRLAVRTDDGLVLEDADGGDRVLLEGTRYANAATFSPDGSSVLLAVPTLDGGWSADPSMWAVEVARSDGSELHVVATDAALGAWSRDGRRIVYTGRVAGHLGVVIETGLDGGASRVLARGTYVGSYTDNPPQLSPDGRSVAYVCANAAGGTLCVTRGLRTRRFAHTGWTPLWSPDGRWLATQPAGNLSSGAALLDTRTGRVRVIAMPKLVGDAYPVLAWSPDSTRLLYERTCGGTFVPGPCPLVTWERTVATGRDRRVSVDGLTWSLAHWRRNTITYVTR